MLLNCTFFFNRFITFTLSLVISTLKPSMPKAPLSESHIAESFFSLMNAVASSAFFALVAHPYFGIESSKLYFVFYHLLINLVYQFN